jgi:hypothetical protein
MSATRRLLALLASFVPLAQAHCDTAEGPAVTDGLRALDTGNLNVALKWIQPDGEAELADVFGKALAVRKLGGTAAEVADRLFLETLVRLHRMGEGVGFTGIQPSGSAVDPVVAAADRALETGDDGEVIALAPAPRREELHRRFRQALARKSFDVDNVPAARDFVAAYVSFFKFAEGEDEDHPHGQHAHGAGADTSHAAHAHH